VATNNEKYIYENTKTSHKRWESMVMYAIHYALPEVLIESQYQVYSYLLDGYLPDFNIAIEIDEPHHLNEKNSIHDHEREDQIKKKLGCEFIRIIVSDKVENSSVYEQINELVEKVKAIKAVKKIPSWKYVPKPKSVRTGEYTQDKLDELKEANVFEFTDALQRDIEIIGWNTSDCEINGHINKSNGQVGFMAKLDGLEISVTVTRTKKPKILVTQFDPNILNRLELKLSEPKKNGEYRTIENFKGPKSRKTLLDYLSQLIKKI